MTTKHMMRQEHSYGKEVSPLQKDPKENLADAHYTQSNRHLDLDVCGMSGRPRPTISSWDVDDATLVCHSLLFAQL